jgi:ElaB/YqjD/DUF883 family membrane-anchored ribosome-binding protein
MRSRRGRDEPPYILEKEDCMPNTLETAGEYLAEAAHKASGAASAFAEATTDAVNAARRTGKQVGAAAEEFMDDTTERIKRHPRESVAATFATGLILGICIGWLIGRK